MKSDSLLGRILSLSLSLAIGLPYPTGVYALPAGRQAEPDRSTLRPVGLEEGNSKQDFVDRLRAPERSSQVPADVSAAGQEEPVGVADWEYWPADRIMIDRARVGPDQPCSAVPIPESGLRFWPEDVEKLKGEKMIRVWLTPDDSIFLRIEDAGVGVYYEADKSGEIGFFPFPASEELSIGLGRNPAGGGYTGQQVCQMFQSQTRSKVSRFHLELRLTPDKSVTLYYRSERTETAILVEELDAVLRQILGEREFILRKNAAILRSWELLKQGHNHLGVAPSGEIMVYYFEEGIPAEFREGSTTISLRDLTLGVELNGQLKVIRGDAPELFQEALARSNRERRISRGKGVLSDFRRVLERVVDTTPQINFGGVNAAILRQLATDIYNVVSKEDPAGVLAEIQKCDKWCTGQWSQTGDTLDAADKENRNRIIRMLDDVAREVISHPVNIATCDFEELRTEDRGGKPAYIIPPGGFLLPPEVVNGLKEGEVIKLWLSQGLISDCSIQLVRRGDGFEIPAAISLEERYFLRPSEGVRLVDMGRNPRADPGQFPEGDTVCRFFQKTDFVSRFHLVFCQYSDGSVVLYPRKGRVSIPAETLEAFQTASQATLPPETISRMDLELLQTKVRTGFLEGTVLGDGTFRTFVQVKLSGKVCVFSRLTPENVPAAESVWVVLERKPGSKRFKIVEELAAPPTFRRTIDLYNAAVDPAAAGQEEEVRTKADLLERYGEPLRAQDLLERINTLDPAGDRQVIIVLAASQLSDIALAYTSSDWLEPVRGQLRKDPVGDFVMTVPMPSDGRVRLPAVLIRQRGVDLPAPVTPIPIIELRDLAELNQLTPGFVYAVAVDKSLAGKLVGPIVGILTFRDEQGRILHAIFA